MQNFKNVLVGLSWQILFTCDCIIIADQSANNEFVTPTVTLSLDELDLAARWKKQQPRNVEEKYS